MIDFWNIRPIYKIDEYGNVYNINTGKKRKVFLSDDGYYSIVLYTNNGKRKNFRINRLVARAFHGEPPADDYVAEHIDNDKIHNHYTNIQWGTQSHNQFWHRKTKGVRTKDLTEDDVEKLCELVARGYSTNYILQYFGIGSKKKDTERFNRFVRRVSAIKRHKLYNDVYEKYLQESSTTIERDPNKYYIDIIL